MASVILGSFEPGSPEWHAARADRIGGSEIGAICGWSKYATRADILARKLDPEVRPQTRAMRRGHLLEPAVLAHLCDDLGLEIDPKASAATYLAEDNPRHLYNPDAITTSGLLLEAKSTSDRSEDEGWGRARTDLVPLGYAAQTQWGMGILGLDECWLGVVAGAHNGRPDLHFATYRLRFNRRIYDYMRRKADAFLAELDTTLTRQEAA